MRDFLPLLMACCHGLRVSQAVLVRRQDLDLGRAWGWIRGIKKGLSVEHPVAGDELRAIERYLHTRYGALPWMFLSERGRPLTQQAANYLISAASRRRSSGRNRRVSFQYAARFVRVLPCLPGLRRKADSGLPRAVRPQAHGSLQTVTTRGPLASGSWECGGREKRARSEARRLLGTSGHLCCN